MRLIDADVLTDGRGVLSDKVEIINMEAYISIDNLLEIIDCTPTAYDVSKPMIRHCNNCEYNEKIGNIYEGGGCLVTYKFIYAPRLKARFCKHFKQKAEAKLKEMEEAK